MTGALKLFFKNYTNFSGRSTRSEYWYVYLWTFIFNMVVRFIGNIGGTSLANTLSIVVGVAIFVPSLAVSVRRLHDAGKTGWWAGIQYIILALMLVFVIIAGINGSYQGMIGILGIGLIALLVISIIMLIFLCRPSDGPNQWGLPAAPKFRN
ncbi:MAG: DUF805 domain-containing protein [Ruminococcus sp.]|nr:DUF805 domain-containing protein [Ruminococcus sp.]